MLDGDEGSSTGHAAVTDLCSAVAGGAGHLQWIGVALLTDSNMCVCCCSTCVQVHSRAVES